MKYIIYIYLIYLSSVFAQNQPTILSGKVFDKETLEPLIGATIISIDSVNYKSTDINGYFKLNITSNSKILKFDYIGFNSRILLISDSSKDNYIIKLRPTDVTTSLPIVASKKVFENEIIQSKNGKIDAKNDLNLNNFFLLQKGKITDVQIYIGKKYSFLFEKKSNKDIAYIKAYNKVMLKYLENKFSKTFVNTLRFINWYKY